MSTQHFSNLERGYKIIDTYAELIEKNEIYGTIKLQLRDVDTFIHKDYRKSEERYIVKTLKTDLGYEGYRKLLARIRGHGLLTSVTPFDERSVEFCEELDIDIIKIASSDIADPYLIGKIVALKKPTIVSTAGATEGQIDEIVSLFYSRKVPLAINHCIARYPTPPEEAQLNQIDYLKARYPDNVIGWSSHEEKPFHSLLVAYAKGARTFEKHIDIQSPDQVFSPYCSTPEEIDLWFKEFRQAEKVCGYSEEMKRMNNPDELSYLSKLWRGIYAKRDLPDGYKIKGATFFDDFYLAIPWKEGQVNCNHEIRGLSLGRNYKKDEPIMENGICLKYSS